ncbi:MAG TPA: hypothetical protein DCY93_04105 [Firmicutes bacterium]|nr:hypothetical protein [Bacillota bacterium]
MKNNICAVVLAGGKGTRMLSNIPKPLYKILDVPAIEYVLLPLKELDIKTYVIANDQVYDYLVSSHDDIVPIKQEEGGYGTGWALKCAKEYIKDYEYVLVIQSDDPLIEKDNIENLINSKDNAIQVFMDLGRYSSFGHVDVRNDEVISMSESSNEYKYANLGRYYFKVEDLINHLDKYKEENGEFTIPGIISSMINTGAKVKINIADGEFSNMNSKEEVAKVQGIIRKRINKNLLNKGVMIYSPELADISPLVQIGADTVITGPCQISGKTIIGKNCTINSSYIINSLIEDSTNILFSFIEDAIINARAKIGPYAHLRPKAYVGKEAVIGNFVEVKNSTINNNAKVRHLSYIGDASVGESSNIGCGTITANYDGKDKHPTIIGKGCFVGCNSTLIAPVTIEDHSLIAAGSVITEDVEKDTLAFGRARQVNKLGRAKGYLAAGKK